MSTNANVAMNTIPLSIIQERQKRWNTAAAWQQLELKTIEERFRKEREKLVEAHQQETEDFIARCELEDRQREREAERVQAKENAHQDALAVPRAGQALSGGATQASQSSQENAGQLCAATHDQEWEVAAEQEAQWDGAEQGSTWAQSSTGATQRHRPGRAARRRARRQAAAAAAAENYYHPAPWYESSGNRYNDNWYRYSRNTYNGNGHWYGQSLSQLPDVQVIANELRRQVRRWRWRY